MSQPSSTTAGSEYRKKKRSKLPLIVALVVVVALIIAGIFVAKNLSETDKAGKTNELTIGILLAPTNLDIRNTSGVALDQVLIDNIYQGLVGFTTGTLEVEPVLATDYEVSENGLTYTFTLRDNVMFHSGEPLTDADVTGSLEETFGDQIAVESPSSGVVEITLAEPNSFFLFQLASREGLILEAAADNDLATTANGTGPYLLEDWKQGDSIALVKNENYWGTPATLDRAIYQYIADGKAAVNASLDGDIDVQIAVLSSLVPEIDADGNFELVRADSTDVFTLAYNSQRAPLDDIRVRTALSQATDSEALIIAQNGDGKQIGSPITSIEPGYEDLTDVNAYDPENARKLLAEAGVTDLKLTVTAPNIYDTVTLDIVATQLAEVGVTLIIEQVEFGTWLEDVYTNHDFDLSYVDHAEPFDFSNYTRAEYYFGFDNKRVQSLFGEAQRTGSTDEMNRHLSEAARMVADEAPAKWLYNYTPTNAIAQHVKGFPNSNTNSRINLEGVTIEK